MNTIEQFLENWKTTNIEVYISIIGDYNELIDECIQVIRKFDLHTIKHGQEIPQEYKDIKRKIKSFELELSKTVFNIVLRSRRTQNTDLQAYLEPIIEKERKAKHVKFINKISSKVGEIVDTSCLHIGVDGNINGYVIGSTGKVSIRTILSGGYNIQCLHYRILVKTL